MNTETQPEYISIRLLALTVKCPHCKAAIGEYCKWGTSFSGGEVPAAHAARYQKTKPR